MNRLLVFSLFICLVYGTVTSYTPIGRFTPFCQNETFDFGGQTVNGFVYKKFETSFSTDNYQIKKISTKNYLGLRKFIDAKKHLKKLDSGEEIEKILNKKHLLDKGYLIKEIMDNQSLNDNLTNGLNLFPGEGLIFSNLEQYYANQILKLTSFSGIKDIETGKHSDLFIEFELYFPAYSSKPGHDAEYCKDTNRLPKWFEKKGIN